MKKTISPVNSRISSLVCVLTLFYFLSVFSIQANSADFTVNLTTDEHDADTSDSICDTNLAAAGQQCTLRGAVEQANAFSGNDRILFNLPSNSTITLTTVNGGEMLIEDGLEIVGTGAQNLSINGGGGDNRIFSTLNANVTISGMTLTNGRTTGFGGAILAMEGSLILEGVHLKDNSASVIGGGVVFFNGIHRLINSTFSGNNANDCGGLLNLAGALRIVNSTFSGNSATNIGGGFCDLGSIEPTTLRNVTITNNNSTAGGGIYGSGLLNLGNTIVAGNNAISGTGPEFFNGGTITSAGGNLIGDSAGDSDNTGIPIPYHSSDIREVNPLFDNLTNNGGTTPTHALLPNSPAIDAGVSALATDLSNINAPLAFDQRGTSFLRWSGASVDIGSFEVQQTSGTTPEEMIEGLIELIQSYNPRLHHGTENSLLSKLNDALGALAVEDTEEAKDSLKAFINHVRAQSGKKITAMQAEDLVEAAEEILEAIE